MIMTKSKMIMMMMMMKMMTNLEETSKSPTHDMLNNLHFMKKVSVILNLLSRAESTIFIAITINNQHFLQISAPLM